MWDDAKIYDKDGITEFKDEIKIFINDPETKKLLTTDNFQKIFDDAVYWSRFGLSTDIIYQFFRYTSGIDVSKYITKIPVAAYASVEFLSSNLIIPNHITRIGSSAFSESTRLKSVTIGNSVTSIGEHAFYGCDSLKDVYYQGTEEEWDKIDIDDNNSPLFNANIHFS